MKMHNVCSSNNSLKNENYPGGCYRDTPVIPPLRRQRQVNLHEFKVSPVHKVNSRTAMVGTQKPCLKGGKKLVGMVAEACNLSTEEAEIGRSHDKTQNNEILRMGEVPAVWERTCVAVKSV